MTKVVMGNAIGAAGESACWELADLDGKADDTWEAGGSPHYRDYDAAWKAYDGMRDGQGPDDPPLPALMPQQLDFVCLTAVAVCGTVLTDREYEWNIHHPDWQELLAEALGQGWTVLEDGSMTCSGCEHCAAVLAGQVPPPPAELPGQLDLFGGGASA